MRAALAALATSLAGPCLAGDFSLALPVDCTLGETCFIQQYMDRAPGPAARDFTCGPLTYDGHSGTDFALPTLRAMEAGVNVLAAAPGRVRGMRDGMPDRLYSGTAKDDVTDRECGNGVVLDHGRGWVTQYCHLAMGSVTVRIGDRVETGAVLGRIGLSGRTQFPHLHLSLRKDDRAVDPFGPGASDACTLAPAGADSLWAEPLPYSGGGVLAFGFADSVPGFDAVKAGTADVAPGPGAGQVVIHALIFGARPGDVLAMRLSGPGGLSAQRDFRLERTQAQAFRAIGLNRPDAGWPPGEYRGHVLFQRGVQVLGEREIAARID